MTASVMVDRVNTASQALGWDEEQTFKFFAVALQDNAQKWIKMEKLTNPDYAENWEWIQKEFLVAFGDTIDESKILLLCKELSMKPDENPRDFMIRYCDLWTKMTTLVNKQVIDIPAAAAERTVDYCRGLYNQGFNHNQAMFQRMFFVAGLPHKLLTKVVQKDIPTIREAYTESVRIHGLEQDPAKLKNGNGNGIHAAEAEEDLETDEQFINQIRSNPNTYRGRGNQNNSGRGGNFRGRSMSRGNRGGQFNRGAPRGASSGPAFSDRNTQSGQGQTGQSQGNQGFSFEPRPKCKYCKKEGHVQDKCYSRIRDNAPCTTRSGATYWPNQQQQAPIRESEEEQVQGAIGSRPSLFQ
jgi:hypothetical protein